MQFPAAESRGEVIMMQWHQTLPACVVDRRSSFHPAAALFLLAVSPRPRGRACDPSLCHPASGRVCFFARRLIAFCW
jgi:hypothetical protein